MLCVVVWSHWRVTLGSMARRSGEVEAMQETLYRVAMAPLATGMAVLSSGEQV